MSINVGIIDARVRQLATDLASEFESRLEIRLNDEIKQRSTAFVFLTVKTVLDLPDHEALDCLTEGGNDFGVDAVHVGDVEDGEFVVTLFQGKYTHNLEKAGTKNFPDTEGVSRVIPTVRYLFDPDAVIPANNILRTHVEEIRSLVRDGHIPQVRVVLCSNGLKWSAEAQARIDLEAFGSQVVWEHVNHDTIVAILQSVKPVNDMLHLTGDALVESFDFCRVLVGKVLVREIESLFIRNGDRLLERNVRRFLGLQGNRVNKAIADTLFTESERPNFYFYNNGITLICEKFTHSGLQKSNWNVQIQGLQVINGGQSCKTIQDTLSKLAGADTGLEKAFVLIRLYELPSDSADLVRNITYATNSQNPVDLRDLRSNDIRQKRLDTAIRDLGYVYHRHRSEASMKPTDISSGTAAESVLSVWRERPHQAKFQGREHFGKLYDVIFTEGLNGTQVVVATLLFRIAENKRRRPPEGSPDFVAYGSCFLAMLMGRYLLADLGITLKQLNHTKFNEAKDKIDNEGEKYFTKALEAVQTALKRLYGDQEISLQRLAATFRRGDLIQELAETGVANA
jgi:hypothetical protein